MIDPATASKSAAGAEGTESAAKLGAKKGIMCDGQEVQPGPDAGAKFADILAKAKAAGQYENKPLGPDGMNVNSTFDDCKLKGMNDQQACDVVNKKYGLNIQPNGK